MKRKDVWLAILLLTLSGYTAWADTTSTVGSVADTWIEDATATHGSDDYMGITGPAGGQSYTMGYLRFDLSGLNIDTVSSATLTLYYAPRPAPASNYSITLDVNRFALQGLDNVSGNTPQDWDEATLNQSNTGLEVDWPANTGTLIDGRFTDLDGDVAGITETATWNEPFKTNADYWSAGNTTVTVTGPTLIAFLNSRVSDNDLVTFVISGDRGYGLATKEHATEAYRPTLTLTYTVGGANNPYPANGANANKDLLTQLSWTLNPPGAIGKCDVYFGTEPNIADNEKLTFNPAVTSVNISAFTGFTTPLPEGTYYWRVDCYKGDPLPEEPNLIGLPWSFTASTLPEITQQTLPAYQAKFIDEEAIFTVGIISGDPVTYTWYRSEDNANNTPDDDIQVGTDSDTLTISNIIAADAGYYYCVAVNPGEVRTNPTRLSVKQLYAHWTLDGDADDSSGNALHGTLYGEPVFDTGVNELTDQAMVFDGINDYIQIPANFSDFTPGMTLIVWAKPTAAGSWARFIDFGNIIDTTYSDIIYLSRNGTSTNLSFNVYSGTSAGLVTAAEVISLNEWQMFVATMDDSGNVTLYKNGLPVQTGTVAIPAIVNRTLNYIGESNWEADALYTGMMDDIAIYNYAKSADEVADMYAAIAGNFCRTEPTYDLNGDCLTTLADFAMLAAQWMDCGMYPNCP